MGCRLWGLHRVGPSRLARGSRSHSTTSIFAAPGPRGSGSRAAFLGRPVPRDPPQKREGAPGQPPGLPRWGPWKPGGSSGPQGGPQDWRGVGPGETRENSALSGGPERGTEGFPEPRAPHCCVPSTWRPSGRAGAPLGLRMFSGTHGPCSGQARVLGSCPRPTRARSPHLALRWAHASRESRRRSPVRILKGRRAGSGPRSPRICPEGLKHLRKRDAPA